MNQTLKDTLEAAIDAASLSLVLATIAEICAEKADHLRSNWQDVRAAKRWDKASIIVERTAPRVNMTAHSAPCYSRLTQEPK